jgi:hypothetical protein
MKKRDDLTLSDYIDIWKVIIYLLLSKKIADSDPVGFF